MMERDEELQRLLKGWEAPSPSGKLDSRVWSAYRQSKHSWRWKWVPVAAALFLAVGIAAFWPTRSGSSLETRMDAAGFQPIANGAITVVKAGEKQ